MLYRNLLIAIAVLYTASALAEVRDYAMSADRNGHEKLLIETGYGMLSVIGVDSNRISARLELDFNANWTEQEIQQFMNEYLVFALEARASRLVLTMQLRQARQKFLFWQNLLGKVGFNDWPDARLDVEVPATMQLEVQDGAGTMSISGMRADLEVDDGSGTLEIADIDGNVFVEDGSGTLVISNIRGHVEVIDGSGSIAISNITDSVRIRDGSGNIEVEQVAGDLDIRDGSGRVVTREITGNVNID